MKIPFDTQKTVFIIDGSSFLYRAFYSLPPMNTRDGQPVQVAFGFCRMIGKLIKQFSPHFLALTWDSKREVSSIRNQLYPEYKATREAAPMDLSSQRDLVKEFCSIIGIKQYERPGVEADDILHSLALDFSFQGYDVALITSDKDMRQCVGEKVIIIDPFKDIFLDIAAVEERYGIPLERLVFYFALLGDTSDNIPGVKGIGPKTAQELVNNFSSLAELYENLEKVIKPRTRELLKSAREDAFVSEKLFKLYYYDFVAKAEDCSFSPNNWSNAREYFARLSFASFLKGLPTIGVEHGIKEDASSPIQANFITVTTIEQLHELVEKIKRMNVVAVDTETTGLRAEPDALVGISFCLEEDTAYYVPIRHKNSSEQLAPQTVIDIVKPILEDPQIKKYFHHAKFDRLMLSTMGIDVKGIAFDTLIAASLVTKEGQRINLKWLSDFYLNQRMLSYDDVVTKKSYKNFAEVPLSLATMYAAADSRQTFLLVPILEAELAKNDQTSLFYDVELPLSELLYAMEREGISLDLSELQNMSNHVGILIASLEDKIKELIPQEWSGVNLNSPKQLEELLFTVLKLPPLKKTAKKTGFSTDSEVLAELGKIHPVPLLIEKYREFYKIKSTYLDSLKNYVDPTTNRIHTSFNQTSTATGRLSSSDPNLQNIPTGTIEGSTAIRSAFKPSSDEIYISADYSQIELRVLAYLSQDERLKQAFLDFRDIHSETAMGLFTIPREEVSPEQRSLAKRINFSIMYGLSPFGLSKDLDIPYKEAKLYIDRYFAQYPGVVAWMDNVEKQAKEIGYVQTLWGRRRYVPGLKERNRAMYDLARRMAINTVVQGTAADLMKIGMLSVGHALKDNNLNAKILLQIHDELLVVSSREHEAFVKSKVQEVLQNIVSWNIPLIATVRSGSDWHQVTK